MKSRDEQTPGVENQNSESMTELRVALPAAVMDQLRAEAERLGIAPEALARAFIAEAVKGHDARFAEAAEYLMAKNAELYRRLA